MDEKIGRNALSRKDLTAALMGNPPMFSLADDYISKKLTTHRDEQISRTFDQPLETQSQAEQPTQKPLTEDERILLKARISRSLVTEELEAHYLSKDSEVNSLMFRLHSLIQELENIKSSLPKPRIFRPTFNKRNCLNSSFSVISNRSTISTRGKLYQASNPGTQVKKPSVFSPKVSISIGIKRDKSIRSLEYGLKARQPGLKQTPSNKSLSFNPRTKPRENEFSNKSVFKFAPKRKAPSLSNTVCTQYNTNTSEMNGNQGSKTGELKQRVIALNQHYCERLSYSCQAVRGLVCSTGLYKAHETLFKYLTLKDRKKLRLLGSQIFRSFIKFECVGLNREISIKTRDRPENPFIGIKIDYEATRLASNRVLILSENMEKPFIEDFVRSLYALYFSDKPLKDSLEAMVKDIENSASDRNCNLLFDPIIEGIKTKTNLYEEVRSKYKNKEISLCDTNEPFPEEFNCFVSLFKALREKLDEDFEMENVLDCEILKHRISKLNSFARLG